MHIKKILKPVLFLGILFVMVSAVTGILEKPVNEQWDASGLSYVYDDKDFYDVVFSGTSMTITNVSIQELYSEYGIAAVTIGEPSQSSFLSYYSIEETLKYQSPRVVCFDVNSLFYPEDDLEKDYKNEYHYIHYSLDGMKNNKTKYEAFLQAKEINPGLDFWNYFSKLYYSHSNWEELSEDNFVRESGKNVIRGNLMLFDVNEAYRTGRSPAVSEVENTGEAAEIPEINRKYLLKLIDLCKEKGTQLVLLHSGGVQPWSWQQYNAIEQVAEEYGLDYLDMNLYEEEMGFDWRYDMADNKHFNVGGAKKWTDVLGEYLTSNYELADRREDERYDVFRETEQKYLDGLEAVKTKQALQAATDLDTYLDTLLSVDREDNTVFIVIKDEGTEKLTEAELEKLRGLGLAADLEDKYRWSYLAVVDSQETKEVLKEKYIHVEGTFENGVKYLVGSGGYSSRTKAGLQLNGEEYLANGRGINIVVYNKAMDEVLSSVYFDTHEQENPATARIVTVEETQYAVDANIWETAQ